MCFNEFLYGVKTVNEMKNQSLSPREIRKVKKLSIWKCSQESFDLNILKRYKKLQILEIVGAREDKPMILENVEALKELKHLKRVVFENCVME